MEPDKQELLRKFSGTVANWRDIRQKGQEGSALDKYNTNNLKLLFRDASESGIDDTELSRAAGISLDELRNIRESLN
jgi:hypothetical protein